MWIIYLFVDIKRYVKRLGDYIEDSQETEKLVIDRKTASKGFYGAKSANTGAQIDIYEKIDLRSIGNNKSYLSSDEHLRDRNFCVPLFVFMFMQLHSC